MSDLIELARFQEKIEVMRSESQDLDDKITQIRDDIKRLKKLRKTYKADLLAREPSFSALLEGQRDLGRKLMKQGMEVKDSEVTLDELRRTNEAIHDVFDHVFVGEYVKTYDTCPQCGRKVGEE